MTLRIIYAPEARAQLLSIFDYIAAASSADVAKSYIDAIRAKCATLAEFPSRGTPRDDLRPGLRTIVFRRRVSIAYDVRTGQVVILGVFYGGQDFEGMLREN